MSELCRRTLIGGAAAGAGLLAATGAGATEIVTAGEVVRRMKDHIGAPWRTDTVDRFIHGAETTPVTGVATVMMATLEGLKAAERAGCTLVVTHEPTFWNHPDRTDAFRSRPLLQAKRDFMDAHRMAVFRFHDNWHALKPFDGISVGMMRQLGWSSFADARDPNRFTLPQTTLLQLARDLRSALSDENIRVIGDPRLPVRVVVADWGYSDLSDLVPLLEGDADVVLSGETREWEAVEYAEDLISSGRKKGLILLGHVRSEQAGMAYCAEWMRSFLPEVPVRFIPISEPYWNPNVPPFSGPGRP